MCRPKHESLPSPHAAVNHSFLQGIRSVSTPLSSLFHALPPCVQMRGPGKCLEQCKEGGGWGKWKKEGVVRLMSRGLGLGSSASWEKMMRKRCIVPTSFIYLRIHTFVFVSLTCDSDCCSFVYSYYLFFVHKPTHSLIRAFIHVISGLLEQQSAFCSACSFYEIDYITESGVIIVIRSQCNL